MITEHDDDYVGDVVKKESKENKRNVFFSRDFFGSFFQSGKKQKTTIGFVCANGRAVSLVHGPIYFREVIPFCGRSVRDLNVPRNHFQREKSYQ